MLTLRTELEDLQVKRQERKKDNHLKQWNFYNHALPNMQWCTKKANYEFLHLHAWCQPLPSWASPL